MAGPTSTQTAAENTQAQVGSEESSVLNTLNQEAQQVFATTSPGLTTAENYYTALASGNPNAISQATGPAVMQIGQQENAAKANILATTPAGGALQTSLAELPISTAEQIAGVQSNAVSSAPATLAQLALSGTSAATGLTGAATSAANASTSATSAAAGESAEQKATSLGLLGSLGETAGSLATL